MIKETPNIQIDSTDYIMIGSKRHSYVVLYSPSGRPSYLAFKRISPLHHNLMYNKDTKKLIALTVSDGTEQPTSYTAFRAMGTHSLKNVLTISISDNIRFIDAQKDPRGIPEDYITLTLTLDPDLVSSHLLVLTLTFMATLEKLQCNSHTVVLRELYYAIPTIYPSPGAWMNQAQLFYNEILRLKGEYGYFVITPIESA